MATAKKQVSEKSVAREESGSTNNFSVHMIGNKKTEMYVKFAKIMIICQGPYSVSRCQELEQLKRTFNYASHLISDETYRLHRKTTCAYDRTEEFYEYFRAETQRALEEGNNLVILDPTMSNTKQNRHYLALAYKMQYVFLVCPPLVTRSNNPVWPPKSQARSFQEHGTFIQYSNMFQHLFCAWYLHDIDSLELRHVAKLYVQDCLDEIPEFGNIFARVCPAETSSGNSDSSDAEEYSLDEYRDGKHKKKHTSHEFHGSKGSSKDSCDKGKCNVSPRCTPDSFGHHFSLDEQRQDLAYCVVKIFQGMKSMNDYFKESKVMGTYGKMSKLLVAGFVVSPHVVAARIKLTHNQKDLWDMPDDIDENTSANLPCASALVEESKVDLPDVKMRLISSKSNQTLINSGIVVHEPTDVIYPNAKGRTCHIVLGKAPGAPKRNIDYDVAFALKRERSVKKEDVEVIDLERCVVKRLGKYWLIYLKEMYYVNGFFSSCCKPFPYENAIS